MRPVLLLAFVAGRSGVGSRRSTSGPAGSVDVITESNGVNTDMVGLARTNDGVSMSPGCGMSRTTGVGSGTAPSARPGRRRREPDRDRLARRQQAGHRAHGGRHAVRGLTILVLAGAKLRGSVRVGMRRDGPAGGVGVRVPGGCHDRSRYRARPACGSVLATGRHCGPISWRRSMLLPVFLWHIFSRPVRPKLTDLDRRAVLPAGVRPCRRSCRLRSPRGRGARYWTCGRVTCAFGIPRGRIVRTRPHAERVVDQRRSAGVQRRRELAARHTRQTGELFLGLATSPLP